MDRRALLLAAGLLAAGAAVAALGVALAPDDHGEAGVTAHLPGAARYDARNGTTLVATLCRPAPCGSAYLVAGDAREAVSHRFYLRAADASAWTLVDVERFEASSVHVVTQAYAGPFEPTPIWPRFLVLLSGFALLGAGAAAAGRALAWTPPWAGGLGAGVGVAGGASTAYLGPDGVFLVGFLSALLALAAVALVALRVVRPGFLLPVGVVVALGFAGMLLGGDYFPRGTVL